MEGVGGEELEHLFSVEVFKSLSIKKKPMGKVCIWTCLYF